MARNVDRPNPTQFKEAFVALAVTQIAGETISGWDGVFNMLIPIYSSDVNFQIREPAKDAVLDEEGNEVTSAVPATAWQTYATFDSIFNDTVELCSNYEYRFQTASAGSRVLLGVQWGGPN